MPDVIVPDTGKAPEKSRIKGSIATSLNRSPRLEQRLVM
jgi:hypothetical protein